MSRLIVMLAITTAASAATSAYLWKQTQQERSRADELQARVTRLERPRAVPAQPEPEQSLSPAANDSPPQAIKPAPSAAPARAMLGTFRGGPPVLEIQPGMDIREAQERFVRQQRALLDDPEYREARRAQQRIMLRQNYPDLAEGLGISAEQADRLLDLLAGQQLDPLQQSLPFAERDDPEAVASWQRKIQEKQRADQAAIAELLGADGQQRWTDYQASLGTRFRVRQLRTELEGSGTPLQQDQIKPLQQALVAGEAQIRKQWQAQANRLQALGRPPSPAEQLKMQEDMLKRTTENNEMMRNAVSQVLSHEQLESYKQMQDRELQMLEAQLRLQRAQLEAQERSGMPMEGANAYFSVAPSTNVVISN